MCQATDTPVIIGCGILAKEIRWLINKNGWRLDNDFLPPSLHADPEALAANLTVGLSRHQGRPAFVFYGGCHPAMNDMLREARTFRIVGPSCVEMLLGRDVYQSKLRDGALFLLEDWAMRWDTLGVKAFAPGQTRAGADLAGDRRFLLGVRTPCSADFREAAENVKQCTGLPLRWMDAELNHLEMVLKSALKRRQVESA